MTDAIISVNTAEFQQCGSVFKISQRKNARDSIAWQISLGFLNKAGLIGML